MRPLSPRHLRFRALANAVCIVAATLCISVSGTADENEPTTTRAPYHPYLAPAPPLAEMDAGNIVDREIARFGRVVFPDLAKGSMPATEFGTIVLPSFLSPYLVLFHETDEGTLVEKREMESGVRFRDLTHDERPGITTKSKALDPDIVTATLSAFRRALANARPPGKMTMRDGVSFYFFNRSSAGRAHSPGSDTEAGKLVQLVWALEQFVDGQVEERELRVAAEEALRANHGRDEE